MMIWTGAKILLSTVAAGVVVDVATIPEQRRPLMLATSLGISRETNSTRLVRSSQSLKEVNGNVVYLESKTLD